MKICLTKQDLGRLIIEGLKSKNRKASVLDISKFIWWNYGDQLRVSGDLFFMWQYDYRWQATELRKKGILKASEKSRPWELNMEYFLVNNVNYYIILY
ncbi:hypothetical protein [Paenibacillus sp. 23TSA30-6]|uniref:hypothetical protein n=1 Tax=Paenibacillus sp. 23TSA30-6 TaxID=2546104 RepID=UPI00178824AD|nr:hypothetical protein [Paenibacillus sp. 23TSA30-6]